MGSQFKVGWYAIPKEKNRHRHFSGIVNKRFKIIDITSCPGTTNTDGVCKDCPGRPIVMLNKKETSLCGYGAPDENFLFETGDWDL